MSIFSRLPSWAKIAFLIIFMRLALFALAYAADNFLVYAPSFPYSKELLAASQLPRWAYSFAGFDGVHYVTIALQGYLGTGYIQAFFPLYPMLLRALMGTSTLLVVVIGLCVNLILFGLVLVLLQKLAAFDKLRITPELLFAVVILFPTSFYFFSLYSEALFLALVLGTFIFARKKRWDLMSLCMALATATRLVGIFLVPAVLLELWQQWRESGRGKAGMPLSAEVALSFIKENARALGLILFGASGLVLYMLYLQQYFSDALYFFHVQSEFGAGRQETIILLPQVIWRSIKMFITVRPFDWKYFSIVQDFLFSMGSLVLLWFAKKWKIRSSYIVFSLLAWILPTLTGTFSSMPRYVLVCFPCFYVLSLMLQESKPWVRIAILTLSGSLLLLNTLLFVQGYWVA